MIYGKTPFAKFHFIKKLQAIVNPSTKFDFLATSMPLLLTSSNNASVETPRIVHQLWARTVFGMNTSFCMGAKRDQHETLPNTVEDCRPLSIFVY